MNDLKAYPVWDAGTRWFHWINALCVLGLIAVGTVILYANNIDASDQGKVLLKTIHTYIGYVFALNLLWRFVWAFMGNRYARWRAILPGGKGYFHALRSYVTAYVSGPPEHHLGHSPIGRVGVSLLLLLITVQAITGLVLAGTDLFYPPFGSWIAEWVAAPGVAPETLVPYAPDMYDAESYQSMRDFRGPFIMIHEFGYYLLLLVIVAHVTGVIVTENREGGSLISAMFTGRKIFSGSPVDSADQDEGQNESGG